MGKDIVRIATRGSRLALYQANMVREELCRTFPGKEFEIVTVKTKGDKILDIALSKIGDKGLFTKELEHSLLKGETDIAVHSLKDLPTLLPGGLKLGGVLKRGEVRDALVSLKGKKIEQLDETDVLATSSLRRRARLLSLKKGFRITDIRGNVDTRLNKMENGHCTAMVMAAAGLQRSGHDGRISQLLDPEIMMPAVAQGAVAMEIRESDAATEAFVSQVTHTPTFVAVKAERAYLRTLEGGCQIPIGCFSETENGIYKISGFVSNIDGSVVIKDSRMGEAGDAVNIALMLAKDFLDRGASEIIREIRNMNGK